MFGCPVVCGDPRGVVASESVDGKDRPEMWSMDFPPWLGCGGAANGLWGDVALLAGGQGRLVPRDGGLDAGDDLRVVGGDVAALGDVDAQVEQ